MIVYKCDACGAWANEHAKHASVHISISGLDEKVYKADLCEICREKLENFLDSIRLIKENESRSVESRSIKDAPSPLKYIGSGAISYWPQTQVSSRAWIRIDPWPQTQVSGYPTVKVEPHEGSRNW